MGSHISRGSGDTGFSINWKVIKEEAKCSITILYDWETERYLPISNQQTTKSGFDFEGNIPNSQASKYQIILKEMDSASQYSFLSEGSLEWVLV